MTQLSSTTNTSELIVSDAISKPTEQPILPPPPHWLIRFALWFRIGFACFLLLGCLLGLTGCAGRVLALNGQPLQWTDTHQITPPLLQQAFDELTIAPQEDRSSLPVLASKLSGKQGQVIVFNFSKVPQLCGAAGCLFAAYAQLPNHTMTINDDVQEGYQLVWKYYLRSPLPKEIPLLSQYNPPNQPAVNFPTLVANQVEDDWIRQLVFSWSGRYYQLEKTALNDSY